MKSRFLASSTVVLALLLGLASSNLLAQITSASSVKFKLQSFDQAGNLASGAWKSSSTGLDTVGHMAQVIASFDMKQPLTSVDYTVNLPAGTVMMNSVADSIYIQYDLSGSSPVTFKVASTDITVLSANDTSGYSSTKIPSVKITDHNSWTTLKTVSVILYKGIYLPKSVSGANTANDGTTKKKMKFSVVNSISTPSTYYDSTNFYVVNDLASKVRLNTSITSLLDNDFLPNSDSLVVLDRFNNLVPDFLNPAVSGASGDTLIISVANHSVGVFKSTTNTTTVGGPISNNSMVYNSDSTAITFVSATAANGGLAVNATTDYTTNTGGEALVHALQPAADDFARAIILFLGGNPGSQIGATGTKGGAAGLKFDASGDTVRLTYTVKGKYAAKGTLLNTSAANTTSTTRNVSAASSAIGAITLTWTHTGAVFNGDSLARGGTFTATLKNIFGDLFTTKTVGTDTDSLGVYFTYRRSGVINATMTSMLQAGGTVTSLYSRPKTRIIGAKYANLSGSTGGSYFKGVATNASGVVNLYSGADIYYGTTSHPQRDSIYVVVYAMNSSSIKDSVLINVEPSPPVAFDLDSLKANLTTLNNNKQVIKGANMPIRLPIFALDTAYNKVSNLDLNYNGGFLTGVVTSTTALLNAINFKVDNRLVKDTLALDSTRIGGAPRNTVAGVQGDSSYIYDNNQARSDSSMINLGGVGANAMGMRLNNLATGNHTVSMQWKPGTLSGKYVFANSRTVDLGLFNVQSASLVDSLTALAVPAVSGADTAGARLTRTVSFTAPAGNDVSPAGPDSLVFIKFIGLASTAGIPDGISKDSVEVSLDGTNYYTSTAVTQGTGSLKDSIAVVPPLTWVSSSGTLYIKIHGFMNPTLSDTTYGVMAATEASPVWASKSAAWTVNDASLGSVKLVNVGADSTDVSSKTLSSLTHAADLSIQVGAFKYVSAVLADKYGNIINVGSAATQTLIAKSVDSTSTGKSLVIAQIFDGTAQTTSGKNMYDTLTVKVDTLKGGTKYSAVDSIRITPAATGSYYIKLMEKNTGAADSIMVTATSTKSGTLTLVSPKGNQSTSKATVVDSVLTVTLRDTMGNVLPDTVVIFAVVSGSGTFVDSNGVAVATPNDTIWVAANAMGSATATLKTGSSDSVAVKAYVGNSAVAVKYFSATTKVGLSHVGTLTLVSKPDSLIPDTASAQKVIATFADADNIKMISLVTYTTMLTLGTDGMFTMAATTDTMTVTDTVSGTLDTKTDTLWIAKKALASYVSYKIVATDKLDSVTTSASNVMVISPLRGKSKLSTAKVNVADIMRLVYLFVQPVPITPTVVDYLGLDLDSDGMFTGDKDLIQELKIWKGTGTLAAAGEQQNVSAKVALSFKEIDKANVNLFINLDNSGALNLGVFKVKYDPKLYALGEISRTERIENSVQIVASDNKTEGILTVVVINLEGRSIASGSGAILSIPVEALNGKFDGTGEISLLNASFDENVQTDLNKEVLSPKANLPKAYALGQNFPNPFNPSTTIAYDIPEGKEVQVRLNIYNIRGQLVRTLVNEVKSEGSYQIQWDGSNSNGQQVSSGVYFYRIQAGDYNQTRKMVILK